MPRPNFLPVGSGMPWRGLNERLDPRHIADNELAKADNVVIRHGRVAPRPGYSSVRDGNFGYTHELLLGQSAFVVADLTLDLVNRKIYWANALFDRIEEMPMDGGTNSTTVSGLGNPPKGLDVDTAATPDIIYFTESHASAGKIRKFTIGGAAADLFTSEVMPEYIAHDATNTKLYWNDATNNTIRWGNDDGSGSAAEVVSAADAKTPTSLAVDPAGGFLYWSAITSGSRGIYRSTLAGANVTRLVALSDSVNPRGVSLDLTNSKVYWLDLGNAQIQRNNLDGTGSIETLLIGTSSTPYSMRLDVAGGRAYWCDLGSNGGLYRGRVSISSFLVSSFWLNRSILGVDASAGDYTKDIVLLQLLDDAGSRSELVVWFPTSNDSYMLSHGYAIGNGTTPSFFVTNSRTADPTAGDPLGTKSGRMSFAWTGAGINTAKGGCLIADGDDSSDSPFNFNYVLGDSIWTFDTNGSTGGTFTITFNGETTGNITYNNGTTCRDMLLALDSIDALHVVFSGDTFTVRFIGVWSGQDVPTPTADGTNLTGGSPAATVTVAQTQAGGTDTGSMIYLRPAGLPRPVPITLAAESGSTTLEKVQIGSASTSTGTLDGFYQYYLTWYSSRWDIESPPTAPMGHPTQTDPNYVEAVAGTGGKSPTIIINKLPSTLYFETTTDSGVGNVPFRHIDKVRIYRQKWGSSAGGTTPPDGTGAQTVAQFVTQIDISNPFTASATVIYTDLGAVNALGQGVPVPIENEYPPKNANFVTIHGARAFYAGITPGDHNLWMSELSKLGGISHGEYGYEYVHDNSFSDVGQNVPSDSHFTGLYGDFGSNLIIGTSEKVLTATITESFLTQEPVLTVTPLRGTSGIASHWCIAESDKLPDNPGVLFWLSPRGHVYVFDGSRTRRISNMLTTTPDSFIRKYWNDPTYFDTGLDDSLYYASMVVDPINNRLIVQGFDTNSAGIVLVLDIETGGWTRWPSFKGYGWIVGREWTGTDKGKDIVCFGGSTNAKFFKLEDGKQDDSTSFTATYRTKRYDLALPTEKKAWREFVCLFDRRLFGAVGANQGELTMNLTNPVTGNIGSGSGTITLTESTDQTADRESSALSVAGTTRDIQLEVTITQDSDDKTHPELMAVTGEGRPVRMAREG